jgi:GT2 family glycosyltransferase
LNNKLLSFVIPLFNHVAQTQEMFSSLWASLPQGLNCEVIFVDDASTDETRDWLAGLADARIHLVLNERNLGYARTNNIGVARASGHYLALLNNDLILQPGWLEPMLAALETPELNAGIVGNLQFRASDKVLDHAGVVLTPNGKFEHICTESKQTAQTEEVYVVTGACMLMRKADFAALGGFDEVFVNGCEDIDLCLKVRANGQKIYVAPSSKILHHVSLSRSRVSLQNEKNSQYLFSKWRKEIKLQLTQIWLHLLNGPDHGYAAYVDGELTSSFRSQPHIAAMTIAQAALLREEARWARELGQTSANGRAPLQLKIKGLSAVPLQNEFVADTEVLVSIANLQTACNFYVCGKLAPELKPDCIVMTLTLNNAQEKVFHFANGPSVNVGLIYPLMSTVLHNNFKLNVFFKDEHGHRAGEAKNAVLITHFVIDDQVVIPHPDFCD